MLQVKCKHSNVLRYELCSFCNAGAPEKLLDICFEYINKHIEAICPYDEFGKMQLMENLALPVEICERLLNVRSNSFTPINSSFINIFKNINCTRLKRVRLRKTEIDDDDLEILLRHRLVELDLSQSPNLTSNSIRHINEYGSSLYSLSIVDTVNIFAYKEFGTFKANEFDRNYILIVPTLRRLSLRGVKQLPPDFYNVLLNNLVNLTHLDLSNCSDLGNFEYSSHLVNLKSLILYNVNYIKGMVPAICTLTNLCHLDISQSKDEFGKYDKATKMLRTIIESLPKLTSLDISGTNLAGRGVAETTSESTSDIPGLSLRANNPLQFLGLYETSHNACFRHDIPAKLIAGNANEEQILIAALAYLDRPKMLQKVINELFHLFRTENIEYVGQALNVVLEAMNRHLHEKHIQISGSATLFYIAKSAGIELHDDVRVKRNVITTLLNGMGIYKNDDTMMKNGCLTLCQFKIPTDVLFDYERLVNILLHSVHGWVESFVQRIGIYLLNSLACQVDGQQKMKLGELGVIDKMIWLIKERLDQGICDDVLEVAWSTMWNVTDETPMNCKKFLENKGMAYFLACLKEFHSKEELLRNMMGLLGNVAEVKELRHYLLTSEYITVFSGLLESECDGIEVSYNAAGVISHIASDGPEVWTVDVPSRQDVLKRMVQAIERWNLNSPRNINYRSFEPILNLVRVYHTPECQHWAVWALANLTKVYPDKYCVLIEKEGGLDLLQEVVVCPGVPLKIRELANIVIENYKKFAQTSWPNEESLLDG